MFVVIFQIDAEFNHSCCEICNISGVDSKLMWSKWTVINKWFYGSIWKPKNVKWRLRFLIGGNSRLDMLMETRTTYYHAHSLLALE